MATTEHKPELIIIAGPNGSGKTSIHDVPISKIISRYYKSIRNCKTVSSIVDRLYIYDNSIDDAYARPLFRLSNGQIAKQYTNDIPEWAQTLINIKLYP